MSATSQAIQHWHDCQYLARWYAPANEGHRADGIKWAKRLVGFIREDFHIPDHIELRAASPVLLTCEVCGAMRMGVSANVIGRFLDEHTHCRRGEGTGWQCDNCGYWEWATRKHCRVCEGPVENRRDERAVRIHEICDQRTLYHVERQWGYAWLRAATVDVGSLREALRAARAMYQHEKIRVTLAMTSDSWSEEHQCK